MFDRLVETGFRALAASVSGISIGWFLTVSAHAVQTPVDLYVAIIGASLIGVSAILMVCAIGKVIFIERAPENVDSSPKLYQSFSSSAPSSQETQITNQAPLTGVGRSL